MAKEIDPTELANKIGIIRCSAPTRKSVVYRQEVRIIWNEGYKIPVS